MAINNVTVSGNVTAQPFFREVGLDKKTASIKLAVNKSYLKNGVWEQGKTAWVKVVCWGNMAEKVRDSVSKGMTIVVTGELESNEYEAKEGHKVYETNVQARTIDVVQKTRDVYAAPTNGKAELTLLNKDEDFGPEPTFNTSDEIPF